MSSELIPLTCECCGGPMDRATLTCPYCGTQYRRNTNLVEHEVYCRIETPGVKTLVAQCRVSRDLIGLNTDAAAREAEARLRGTLADGLKDYMKLTAETDYMNDCQIIRGVVRVVEPTW